MNIVVVTPAATEPVSATEARAFLRLPSSDEDALLNILIASAREVCEAYTGLSMAEQTLRVTGQTHPRRPSMVLPRMPVATLVSVKVSDVRSSSWTTVSNDIVAVSVATGTVEVYSSLCARIMQVEYATPASCPALAKRAILALTAHMYENRGDTAMPANIAEMLAPIRRTIIA